MTRIFQNNVDSTSNKSKAQIVLSSNKAPAKKKMTKSNTFFFLLGVLVTFIIMSAQMIFWETLMSQTVNTKNTMGHTTNTAPNTRSITKSSVPGMTSRGETFLSPMMNTNNLRGRLQEGVSKRMSSPGGGGLYNYPSPKRTPKQILDETMTKLQNDETLIDQDIFNCGHPIYGKCQYFYPKEFFQTAVSSSTGSTSFGPLLTKLQEYKENHKLWLNMPFIGLWTVHFTPQWTNPVTKQPFREKRITFFHVHKTGGTSIVTHLRALKQKTELAMNERKIFMFQTNRPLNQLSAPMKSQRIQMEQQLLEHVYPNAITFPNSTTTKTTTTTTTTTSRTLGESSSNRWLKENSKHHVMFAIVRDPVDRFISAIGQAMGAFGSKTPLAQRLQRDCVNSNVYSLESSRHTIQCVIDFVRDEDGFYQEVHFTPQAVEISFATGTSEQQVNHNVPVAIFNYPELKLVLEELGVPPSRKIRDGSSAEYRPTAVLQNMTVADYTPDLIRQVCELYEVDVVMMRSLGFPNTKCHGIV